MTQENQKMHERTTYGIVNCRRSKVISGLPRIKVLCKLIGNRSVIGN